MRSSSWFFVPITTVICLVPFLFVHNGAALIQSPNIVLPPETEFNLFPRLWQSFQRQLGIRQGLWLRVSPTGIAFQQTTYTRNISTIPPGPPTPNKPRTLLTLTYDNPSWPSDGRLQRRFLYHDGSPPVFGVEVYDNGTVSDVERLGLIVFYPKGNGFWLWPSVTDDVSLYALERFVVHPLRPALRLNLLSVYIGGNFTYFSYAREDANAKKPFVSKFFTDSNESVPLARDNKGPYGTWARVTQCVRQQYKFSRAVSFVRGRTPGLPIKAAAVKGGRVAFRLPDGVDVSVPKRVGSFLRGVRTVFQIRWDLGNGALLYAESVYGKDGSWVRDCTTTYYPVSV